MSRPGDDAQREMEQRALRNVRGLLDKIEDQDRLDKRAVKRIAVVGIIVAVIGTTFIGIWISARKAAPTTNPLVIPAVPKSPAK